MFGAVFYLVFGSAELQAWSDPSSTGKYTRQNDPPPTDGATGATDGTTGTGGGGGIGAGTAESAIDAGTKTRVGAGGTWNDVRAPLPAPAETTKLSSK